MKVRQTIPRSTCVLLLALLTTLLSCKKDGGVGSDEVYIPLITNSWTDVARPTHKFNLTAQKEGVASGTFTGEEAAPEFLVNPPLRGTFSNRNIAFTVTRPKGDTAFSGKFIADTLIDLGGIKIFRRNN
ncbi:MAG: hypothetical protein AABZ61_10685 [Bacteroidota bacterium]